MNDNLKQQCLITAINLLNKEKGEYNYDVRDLIKVYNDLQDGILKGIYPSEIHHN